MSLTLEAPVLEPSITLRKRREWLVPAVSSLAFLLIYLVFIVRTTFRSGGHLTGTLFDDALVSLRYAHNLATGSGLVWNPGEQPPVEGYTDLGWTLVMSLMSRIFSLQIAPIAVAVLGAVVLTVGGCIAAALLGRIGCESRTKAGGTLLVLACYPAVYWTLRGMEVGLLSLLLLAAIYLAFDDEEERAVRTIVWISVLSGIGVLTRNDSVLLFAVVLVFALWLRGGARHLVQAIGPLAAAVLLQVGFREVYYRELVPNTYVLKMTGVALSVRLLAGVTALADTLAPLAGAASIILLVACSAKTPARVRQLCALVFVLLSVQWAYLVWIGGDAWVLNQSNRFVATIAPVVLLAAAAGVTHYLKAFWRSTSVAAAMIGVSLVCMLALGLRHPRVLGPQSYWMIPIGWLGLIALPFVSRRVRAPEQHARTDFGPALAVAGFVCLFLTSSAHAWTSWVIGNAAKVDDDVAFAKQGLMLRERLPKGSVIAAAWVGAPAYFSELRTIDLLGKTDPYVARLPGTLPFRPGHNKMDLAHSAGALRPDLVLIDEPQLRQFGYVRLANGFWLRIGSGAGRVYPGADSWCGSPSESAYCPQAPSLYH